MSISRRREAAIRTALGCGRGRLLRLFLAEGVVLAAVGGAAGILLCAWASAVISVPTDLWGPRGFYGSLATFDQPGFTARVGLFGATLSAVTVILVSWAPATSMLRADTLGALRAGARGIAPGSGTLRRPTLRGVIVGIEAALAVLLLVAGGLMIASFDRMFDAWLFGAFATVAILLASAGIYAVVAYAVIQRTREMGIRLALGARPSAIVSLVVREGMVFPVIGVVVGAVASVASAGVLRASLYEIAPTDPMILGVTIALLLLVSAVACGVPGRRATRVDPVEALRAE